MTNPSTFDAFLAARGRADLVLGRAAPLTSRIAAALRERETASHDERAQVIKDLQDLHRQYRTWAS